MSEEQIMATTTDNPLKTDRPVSPAPSNVSMRSDVSKDSPLYFSKGEPGKQRSVSPAEGNVSMRSDVSKDSPLEEPGKQRPVSPAPSNVSIRSDESKDSPLYFSKGEPGKQRPVSPAPSNVSIRSDVSKDSPLYFSKGEPGKQTSVSPAESNVSMRSDVSKDSPLEEPGKQRPVSPAPSNVSMRSDVSKDSPLYFSKGEPGKQTSVSPAESNVSMRSDVSKDSPLEEPGWPQQQEPVPNSGTNKGSQSDGDPSHSRTSTDQTARDEFKEHLKKKFLQDYKDVQSQHESHTDLTDGEQTLIESYNEIFQKSSWTKLLRRKVRTVLMKGVAGIGKTFRTREFMVDWAKGNSNKDIDLIVPLHFSDLNSRRDKVQSLEDLLNDFFKDVKPQRVLTYENYKITFILDGLEQCKLPLDFKNKKELTDIKERASMDQLLTNLIKGNLLSSARLWIISRPSGDNKIPPEYVQRETECQAKDTRYKLRTHLKKRFVTDYEYVEKNKSQTELYKIKTVPDKEDEQILLNDIFEKNKVRTVLMKGVAGIGKTFKTRKFMVDWAKGNSNKDIDLIVPLQFSELSSRGDLSVEDLLNHFFSDVKPQKATYDKYKITFILDGLEQSKLPLEFGNNKELTGIKERASMDQLLTNLIKGKLLPSARLWIISQPSGVNKIPPEYVQRVTECRDNSKRREELVSSLRKRFSKDFTEPKNINHPNQSNTEHIIHISKIKTEVNDEDEDVQTASLPKVNQISDIFKEEQGETIRSVLTIGEAGVGKSFHVQKFIKAWAEKNNSILNWLKSSAKALMGKTEDGELIFPLTCSNLQKIKEENKTISLVGLLNHFFKETKQYVVSNYEQFRVLFILDGLDTSELPLDFENSNVLTDIRELASVDVLLTNLIKGNLLPSAQIWITSRPSTAKQLPDRLYNRLTEIREKPDITSQKKLKSELKEQFARVSEGIDKQKTSALLNEIYTDLYIIEGERGEVNAQHEARQVQDAKFKPMTEETAIKYHNIFKPAPGATVPMRTVLTIGVAGSGKTIASMKYMLDWAEGTANQDTFFTFPLPFRELNLRKEGEHSFKKLLYQFFPAMKKSEITDYDKYPILIVLDGLDECRLDLNFSECVHWTDVSKPTSVNVLLVNLIRRNLLPKAQIWITSRPAASNKIPPDKVDRVTEVRGFNDDQKEEYFRKRFSDTADLAEKILSHVKKSRSLYIMCHIPVFCWITSRVMEELLKPSFKKEEEKAQKEEESLNPTNKKEEEEKTKKEKLLKPSNLKQEKKKEEEEERMPKTQTDMYIHFLLLQCKQANVKYGAEGTGDSSDAVPCWNERNKETVLSLGKLAFEGLKEGNLLFTEEDLKDCGIDVEKTAVFSGLFTQVKREGYGTDQKKFFCFVHLSIQEFLAAFHTTHAFSNNGKNLLSDSPGSDLYKTAVDKALDSETGDWDLFLRFLLGLSLETNQNLLKDVLKETKNSEEINKKTIEYIKKKIEEISDPDKNISLFHCLNELNDHSLVEDIKNKLKSNKLPFETFTASQWSALTYVMLMSDENLDEFDLKKYLKSEKVLLGMLPVVKVSKTTLLSWCELTEESCKGLTSSVLKSASSNLTKLDLSHNDLLDSGVELLHDGLKSVHCKLETLKLSGCQVTEKGCSVLASAIKSNTTSHLKHLDLSYNHPGEGGERELCALREEKKLETLCLDHCGPHRLKPGIKKYVAHLTFNEDTASKRLVLCEENKKVKTVRNVEEKVARPENEERFKRSQVFCEEGLKGPGYWEVEWKGKVGIAVSYAEVGRRWDRSGGLGSNDMSWSLICSETGYTAMHGNTSKKIEQPTCQKIAVFLDWESGSLSYYSVTSGKLTLIHTFTAKFTEKLFPAFWFKKGSVTLCDVE